MGWWASKNNAPFDSERVPAVGTLVVVILPPLCENGSTPAAVSRPKRPGLSTVEPGLSVRARITHEQRSERNRSRRQRRARRSKARRNATGVSATRLRHRSRRSCFCDSVFAIRDTAPGPGWGLKGGLCCPGSSAPLPASYVFMSVVLASVGYNVSFCTRCTTRRLTLICRASMSVRRRKQRWLRRGRVYGTRPAEST